MKKTLITTLCALALPAMADNFILDYTQSEAVKVTNASPTLINSTVLTLTDVSLTYPGGGTPAVIGGDGNASTYVSHFYAPWLNFKNNAQGWTYTLTFKAEANISLTDIQVALFTCYMGGSPVANATPFSGTTSANYSLTLAAAASASTPLISGSSGSSETPFSNHGGNANSTPSYDFGTSSITTGSGAIVSASSQTPVLLTEGEKYVLTLTVDKANKASNAFGVGIGGINLVGSVVPEPATATLSLLALAGLAARRRRK